MNDKVKLELVKIGVVKEYEFNHALNIMRLDKYNDFKVVGNHEFKDNELIIKPSKRGRKKSSKPSTGKEGTELRESSKDIDPSV